MSHTTPTCRLRTLSRGPSAHVQRCESCGCISVHIGAFTVRLDAHAFAALAGVLGEAATRLETERTGARASAFVGEA